MATMTLELPEPLTPEEARLELACALYAQRRLSFGQAREMAGVHTWDSLQELGKREIEYHYGVEQLEEDLETIRTLGR
ncbi:MAG: UPF0175 family protein [Armatimonadetes bacterium]|nr:UPF0175 family protein [Armatimonadota bacterium]